MLVKEKKTLALVLDNLESAISFIMDEKTAIMRDSSMTSSDVFTSSFYHGERYSKITKEIGSNLAQLFTAREMLRKLI